MVCTGSRILGYLLFGLYTAGLPVCSSVALCCPTRLAVPGRPCVVPSELFDPSSARNRFEGVHTGVPFHQIPSGKRREKDDPCGPQSEQLLFSRSILFSSMRAFGFVFALVPLVAATEVRRRPVRRLTYMLKTCYSSFQVVFPRASHGPEKKPCVLTRLHL